MQQIQTARAFLKNAWKNIVQHNLFQAAAALSYYSLFSLAPLVIIIVAIAGFLIRDVDIQSALIDRVRMFANDDAADLVRTIIDNTADEQRGLLSIVIASALMIVGATTAFAHLHAILNRIWNVPATRRQSVWNFFKGRLVSFFVLIVTGVLLAASLFFSTFLSKVGAFAATRLGVELVYWEPLNMVTSWGVTTLLIATIYKFLPDTLVRWSDAFIGAVAASLLLELSKWLVATYVTQLHPSTVYGAAGSVVVFMLWIYVAALTVLIGTEIARTSAALRNGEL